MNNEQVEVEEEVILGIDRFVIRAYTFIITNQIAVCLVNFHLFSYIFDVLAEFFSVKKNTKKLR